MQITSGIFADYLNCKFKGYLKLHGKAGIENEIQILNKEAFHRTKTLFIERVSTEFEGEQLPRGLKVNHAILKNFFPYLFDIENQHNDLTAHFDALSKVPGISFLGVFLYEPILVIPSSKITKKDKLVLTFNSLLIKELQNQQPKLGKIICGNLSRTSTIHLISLIEETDKIIQEIRKLIISEKAPDLILNRHCSQCEFEQFCYKEAKERDNLSLLSGMKEERIKEFNSGGIFTVNQLSYTFRPRRRKKKSQKAVKKYYFSLKALAIRKNMIYIYEKPNLPTKVVKIYLDVEGDPDRSLIYLIGLVIDNGKSLETHSFWINGEKDRKKNIKEVLKLLKQYDEVMIYHYGTYEIKFLNSLKNHFGKGKGKEIERIIEKCVNVLSYIYSLVYFPTYGNGLKEISNYLGFNWTNDKSSGIQSIVWRRKWERDNEQSYKDNLLLYNSEDCLALRAVVNFLIFINKEQEESETKFGNATIINEFEEGLYKKYGGYEFGKPKFVLDEFDYINKCAYFDYQKSKILVRTDKSLEKNRNAREIGRVEYKPNKEVHIPNSRVCPRCKSNNVKNANKRRLNSKIVIDLKFMNAGIKRWVVKYTSIKQYCVNCGAGFNPKRYTIIRGKYGHNLISWIIYQNIVNQVSFRKIGKTLSDGFNLSIGQVGKTGLSDFKIKAANFYQKSYSKMISQIKTWDIIHSDETQVSIKGETGYIWVFTNMKNVIFIYRENRETAFVHDLIESFNGVFISDFYKGYDSLNCKQQKCLIHLMRDINNALFKNQQDEELKYIAESFAALLRKIVNTIDKYGLKKRHLYKHNRDVDKFYRTIQTISNETNIASKFVKRFLKYREKLFEFLNYDGVSWNNNNAEHAFKHFAIYRKNTNGAFTKTGIQRYLILLSIYETCKYRSISFLNFLVSQEKYIESYCEKYTTSGNRRRKYT